MLSTYVKEKYQHCGATTRTAAQRLSWATVNNSFLKGNGLKTESRNEETDRQNSLNHLSEITTYF